MIEVAYEDSMVAEAEGLLLHWKAGEEAPEMKCLPSLAWESCRRATIYVSCVQAAF